MQRNKLAFEIGFRNDSTSCGIALIYDPDSSECNPDAMIHTVTPLYVRYAETDRMGFAHHSNYAVWFECGRVDMMNRIGIPYRDLEDKGFLLPLLELGVRFIRSTTFDDRLEVHTLVRERPRAKIRIEYRSGGMMCWFRADSRFMDSSIGMDDRCGRLRFSWR